MRNELFRSRNGLAVTPAQSPEPDTLDLDRFVPYRLSVVTNRISNAIAAEYSERFGLSIAEWRVMAVLGSAPGLSARDVATRTEMDKVQVSRAVANLVRKKRVLREVDDADARVSRLFLSSRGKTVYDQIVPLALGLERRLLEILTPEERVSLDRLLRKLSGHAKGLES